MSTPRQQFDALASAKNSVNDKRFDSSGLPAERPKRAGGGSASDDQRSGSAPKGGGRTLSAR